jgi:hypothetical protein
LFERREALERMLYHHQPGSPPGSYEYWPEPAVESEIKAIDRQYSLFVSAVADSTYHHDAAEVRALCKGFDHDPIGLLMCRLANYILGGRKDKDQFVRQFPTEGRNLNALWFLEAIPDGEGGRPILFEPEGPTDLYVSELFHIAEAGNPPALSTYMRVFWRADGAFAEFMLDQMERLFREHIDVVLRNWAQVERCSDLLSDFREDLSDDERREILTKSEQYCGTYRTACGELKQHLSH